MTTHRSNFQFSSHSAERQLDKHIGNIKIDTATLYVASTS